MGEPHADESNARVKSKKSWTSSLVGTALLPVNTPVRVRPILRLLTGAVIYRYGRGPGPSANPSNCRKNFDSARYAVEPNPAFLREDRISRISSDWSRLWRSFIGTCANKRAPRFFSNGPN